MRSLLYVSTPCTLPNPADMTRIIDVARANNPKERISGMLLWSDASFAQLLEGPADAVEAMFARIRRDPRHRDIRSLARWSYPQRRFVAEPMALARLSDEDSWRLLQRRTAPGYIGLDAWLAALMLSFKAARRIG